MTFPLWLAAAMFVAPGHPAPPVGPLHLVTEPAGSGVRVRVVGESVVACEVHYVLEVANDSAAGSNRSVQRGAARLRPGVAATVATLTLANAGSKAWTARLKADRCEGGQAYDETARGTP